MLAKEKEKREPPSRSGRSGTCWRPKSKEEDSKDVMTTNDPGGMSSVSRTPR